MRILVNLATLKKGGGQNVALNFLESLNRINHEGIEFVFSAVKDSPIDKYLKEKSKFNIIYMPSHPLKRMIKEYFSGKSIIKRNKIDIVYTYFGCGLYPKSAPQVSGSADSNIYFPEIDFWSDYTGFKKLLKVIIDKYRIWGLKRMTAIIYENESMQTQGEKLFNIVNSVFIKPSINTNYFAINNNLDIPKESNIGLFFCGWQKNKNYLIIPELAAELKNRNTHFHFLLTAPADNSQEHLEFVKKVSEYKVNDLVSIIGPISKEQIPSLYNKIDFVFLLSKLESFSNNIIEAWHFKKPILISDEQWSHSICQDAAIYVSRNDVCAIVNSVEKLIDDSAFYNSMIEKGNYEISTYPTIDEKTIQELNFIKKVYENH